MLRIPSLLSLWFDTSLLICVISGLFSKIQEEPCQAGAEPLSRGGSLVRLLLFHIKLFVFLYLLAQQPKRELLYPGPGRNLPLPGAGMAWGSHTGVMVSHSSLLHFIFQRMTLCSKVGLPFPELASWLTAANIKQSTKLASEYQEPLVVIKRENQNSFNAFHTV